MFGLEQVAPLEGLDVFVDASPGFLELGSDLGHLLSRWGANVTANISPHGVIVGLRAGRPHVSAPFPFWRNRLLARILSGQLQIPRTLGCNWVASTTSIHVHGFGASMITPIARGLCLWHGLYRPTALEPIERALANLYPDAADGGSGDELSRLLADAVSILDATWFNRVDEQQSLSGEVWPDGQPPTAGFWPAADSAGTGTPVPVPALPYESPTHDCAADVLTTDKVPPAERESSAEGETPPEDGAVPKPIAAVAKTAESVERDAWAAVPGVHSYRSREYHPHSDLLPTTPIGTLPPWAEASLLEVPPEVLKDLPQDANLGELLASAIGTPDHPAAEIIAEPPQFYPLSFRPRQHGWGRTGPG